jgi:hypothetical protein
LPASLPSEQRAADKGDAETLDALGEQLRDVLDEDLRTTLSDMHERLRTGLDQPPPAPPSSGGMPVKRLFPVNEALTARHAAVLKVIAADLGCPVDAVYIGNGASGPAVFYEDSQGNEGTRCACTLRSPYWQQCQAKAAVAALLARLTNDPGQGPA